MTLLWSLVSCFYSLMTLGTPGAGIVNYYWFQFSNPIPSEISCDMISLFTLHGAFCAISLRSTLHSSLFTLHSWSLVSCLYSLMTLGTPGAGIVNYYWFQFSNPIPSEISCDMISLFTLHGAISLRSTLHSALCTLHFSLFTFHFSLFTFHGAFCAISLRSTLHFSLFTLHSSGAWCPVFIL